MEFHEPQIVVLPVVERRAVVMIRARRPVIDDTTLELPAGAGNAGKPRSRRPLANWPRKPGSRWLRQARPMPPLAPHPTEFRHCCTFSG